MVEIHPGVFVSNLSTQDWELDDDPPGQVHYLCSGAGIEAGLWRPLPEAASEPREYVPPSREVVLVLEGRARIEIDDGPTLELEAGDLASLPEGSQTRWHLTPDFKELWVLGG